MIFPGMLQSQFDLCKALSSGAEAWMVEHDEAMSCRNVEEAIPIWLAILSNIHRRSSKWAREIENGKSPFSWDEAKAFDETYKSWLDVANRILREIENCEKKSYLVDSADRFREATKDVSLMCLDTERNRASLESIQSHRATFPGGNG